MKCSWERWKAAFGETAFNYLDCLRFGLPNSIHQFLAAGLKSGDILAVYTTNQDCLLEDALSSLGWKADVDSSVYDGDESQTLPLMTEPGKPALYKLHGTMAEGRTKFIRASVRRVELGLGSASQAC